jgi:septal ring factor EnvC (AmiA/AmiB activator)
MTHLFWWWVWRHIAPFAEHTLAARTALIAEHVENRAQIQARAVEIEKEKEKQKRKDTQTNARLAKGQCVQCGRQMTEENYGTLCHRCGE